MNILESVRQFSSALSRRRREPDVIRRYEAWRDKITSKNLSRDGLDVLILLSQQPGDTGSGVSTREMIQEMVRQGHNPHLMAGHYRPIRGDELGLEYKRLHTILFTLDTPEVKQTDADISFQIPGMSLKMPYPNTPYRELTESQLAEYFEAFYRKISTLVDELNPDIIHVNHLWFLPAIAQLAAPWLPVIATARGTGYLLLSDRPSFGGLVLEGARALDKITAISPDIGQRTIKAYGIPEDQIKVIPNGYDYRKFYVDEQMNDLQQRKKLLAKYKVYNIPADARVVLAVGKFVHWKGLQYLIRAAVEYSNEESGTIFTLIVGNGNQDVRLEFTKQIEELGLSDRVKLVGKVEHSDVAKFMNMAEVLVAPSIYEAFGRVVLEGLATGAKLVATNVGGIPSIIKQELLDEELVVLVRPIKADSKWCALPDDEEPFSIELGKAIRKMVISGTSREDRRRIAASVADAGWQTRAAQIVEVYREAIRRRMNMS